MGRYGALMVCRQCGVHVRLSDGGLQSGPQADTEDLKQGGFQDALFGWNQWHGRGPGDFQQHSGNI